MRKYNYLLCICLLSVLALQGQEAANKRDGEWLWKKFFDPVLLTADSLTKTDSMNIDLMLAVGKNYENLLDYGKAYRTYQYCLTLDTANLGILSTLGRAALSLGKATEAERYFRQVLERDSSHFFARYQLAQLYYQSGNYPEAVIQLEFLQRHFPENAAVEYELGNCCLKLQDPLSAFFAYSNAFNLNKENPLYAAAVVNILLRNGKEQAQESLAICDTALVYNPANRTLLQYKGMGYYINEEYLQADTIYTQLLAAGDSSYMTLKYGGASRYYAGSFFNSIDLLEKAYREDTTSAEVCMLLGSALGRTYDRQRAFFLYDRAEENMKPPAGMVRKLSVFRAETLEKDGKREQAIPIYYQLWKEDPVQGFAFLTKLAYFYSYPAVYQYPDEEQRQRGLFINYLYGKERLRTGNDSVNIRMNRNALQSFHDYMLARNVSELPTLAPDSTTGILTADSLKVLLARLPFEEKRSSQPFGPENYLADQYKHWKEKPEDLRILYLLVSSSYRATDQAYIVREEDRGLILYLNYLYASEWLKQKSNRPEPLSKEVSQLLRSFHEYMLDNQLSELPMFTPDKKRLSLKEEDLGRLLEMTNDER
nr:tetratricopeptide repeat protein [Parabacteroides sp. Marseille-P3160]